MPLLLEFTGFGRCVSGVGRRLSLDGKKVACLVSGVGHVLCVVARLDHGGEECPRMEGVIGRDAMTEREEKSECTGEQENDQPQDRDHSR